MTDQWPHHSVASVVKMLKQPKSKQLGSCRVARGSVHLRWGWHRGERARERGKGSLDALFKRALPWGLECVPVEPVRLGSERRTVPALDSSTVARLRADKKRCALLGKGYC